MGFLDTEEISGTTKVDLDAARGYWVEVRNCLPHDKSEKGEGLITSATIIKRNDGTHSTNTGAYRTYMVVASIVSWNLDDGEGESARIWDYSTEKAIAAGVARLPEKYFDLLWRAVDKLNESRTEEEQERFRDGGAGRDQGREAGSAVADPAAAGAVALAGAGAEPHSFPRSSVA